jgi:LCP family protein required for cell wall assembly
MADQEKPKRKPKPAPKGKAKPAATGKAKPPAKAKPAPDPDELAIEDDFLDDLDAEIDEVVSAPTEEFPAPEGAVEPDEDPEEEEPEEEDPNEDEEELEEEEDGALDVDDEEADEKAEDEDRPTGVLAAVTGRLPRIPRRGGTGGGAPAGFGRPRRRFPLWARFLLGSFLIISSIAAATAASSILYLNDIATALGHHGALKGLEGQLERVDGGAAQTIMIIGSDKRPEEIKAGLNGRSDTTILLRIDPERNAIALFSIPRDLIVQIPGYGTGMFNAAYSIGGPDLTLKTVRALTGIEVNHLVNVNFRGFAKAVQAIGCVYVDVDRRYYHSNQGLPPSQQYSEIDVRPGYQRLCGYKALEYVRYRHGDNDVVRSARQQDFLREARARVPATKLFTDRKELIKIFTEFTTSDISDPQTMLQVLKLFIEARNEPVKEIHFEGNIGNRVTTTPAQIEKAVSQFLGIEGTAGPRGATVTPPSGAAPAPETPPATGKGKGRGAAPAPAAKPAKGAGTAGLEGGNYGKKLAYRIRRRNRTMPIFYPTTVIAGSEYALRPRAYNLADPSLSPNETFCYKFTLKTPNDDYYGLQGTRFKDAPILEEPHETKDIGGRTYNLYYDNDRLRMVSWEYDGAVYWVSNSLLQSLSADQMIAIARGAKLLGPPVPPK